MIEPRQRAGIYIRAEQTALTTREATISLNLGTKDCSQTFLLQ
jgi:hypothetical protein